VSTKVVSVLVLILVRLAILFGDRLFPSQWDLTVLSPPDRRTAEDVSNGLVARLAAATWPLLAFSTVVYRISADNQTTAGIGPLVGLFALCMLLTVVLAKLPFRVYLGIAHSIVVLVLATACDIALTLISDRSLVGFFCKAVK
jgi:hypothetical protein